MIGILETNTFWVWLASLRDRTGRNVILSRLARLSRGVFGDVRGVGGGVSELRVHFGPGYRIYFIRRGEMIVVLLSGGDKGSQVADIEQAKAMAVALDRGELGPLRIFGGDG